MQPLTFLMAIENLLTKTTAEKMALPLNLTTGRTYPFYGFQWHPGVNRFQWDPNLNFPHSSEAVRDASSFNEGRRNLHHTRPA
ncbi:gamma-glutamyl hydrolase-like [Oncorhynchus nerka]|uniref:gamma-glutamyl hydrolase-like n=1 Tax=Oncorhynchus nerka TaxID=8023 RepID=UPI0031B8626B